MTPLRYIGGPRHGQRHPVEDRVRCVEVPVMRTLAQIARESPGPDEYIPFDRVLYYPATLQYHTPAFYIREHVMVAEGMTNSEAHERWKELRFPW